MVSMPKSTAAKLLIYILLISIIPLSVVGFVTYFMGQNMIENQAKDHLAAVAVLKEKEILNWVKYIEHGVNQMVSDPHVKKEVEILTTNAINTPLYATSHDALDTYFMRVSSLKNSELLVINLLDRNTGQIIVSSDANWEGQFRDDRRYFDEGKSGVYLSSIYHSFTLDKPTLVIAAPLLDSSGQLLAVLAATVSLEGINEIMQERTGLSVTTETFLVNKDNMLITDTVYAPDGAFKKWIFGEGVERAKAGEQGVDVFIDYRGETVIGSYRWVEGLDLALIAKQDQVEVLASIQGIQNTIIIMFSIIMIFAVLLYLALYRSIGKPIKHLVDATRKVAQGNLNHRVDIVGDDEISTLAKSFNQMTENLNIITASRDELNKEISERKQAEEEIRKFKTIADTVAYGVAIITPEDRFIYVNEYFSQMHGYTPDELIGTQFSSLFSAEERTSFIKLRNSLLKEEDNFTIELQHLRKDGSTFPTSTSGTAIRDDKGNPLFIAATIIDITERKKADQVKDEFIGMVSHELKTPLTVIIGALDVVTKKELSDQQARELLQDAIGSADDMANIVENLLELSRSEAGHLALHVEPADVVEIAQAVAQGLHSKSAAHRLIVDSSSGPAVALADAIKVERILYNLIENAIKYSPKGGDVRVSAHRQDNQVVVEVSDQGIGISRKDQSRLFQSFERIDAYKTNSIAGIGLGLRVCRLLVEALGGRIWVESEPDKGSTFLFTLPAADSDNQIES